MLELLTGALVAIAAVALVLEPLVRSGGRNRYAPATSFPDEGMEPLDLEESESPKVKALLALREIEFDRATGKLSDDDYAELKQRYSEQALAAIRAEEQTTAGVVTQGGEDPAEAAVRRVRGSKRECVTCGVRPEAGAAFCSQCGRSLFRNDTKPRCWMCGADLDDDARFCGQCGFALSA